MSLAAAFRYVKTSPTSRRLVLGEGYLQRDDEKREARLPLTRLVPQDMLEIYGEISPRFWAWLEE